MPKAMLIVDVQNDFTEGGALAVAGGAALAARITDHLASHAAEYELVVASQDWHSGENDNGGHFSEHPDYQRSWPVHCVAETPGAELHPALDASYVDVFVRKGHGEPAYSAFEGVTDDGGALRDVLHAHGVDAVDVVGIATDHCVRASALDGIEAGFDVTVFDDLVAGVDAVRSAAALQEIAAQTGSVRPSAS